MCKPWKVLWQKTKTEEASRAAQLAGELAHLRSSLGHYLCTQMTSHAIQSLSPDFLLLHPEVTGSGNHIFFTFVQNHYMFVLHGNKYSYIWSSEEHNALGTWISFRQEPGWHKGSPFASVHIHTTHSMWLRHPVLFAGCFPDSLSLLQHDQQ